MLTRLKLANFKAWREADLTFGKITGLFGTNSAGKSSLLQLLLLLKQTRNAKDLGLVLDLGRPGDMVNLGTFADIIHGHDEDQQISWSLDWTLPRPLKINIPRGASASVQLEGRCLQIRCEVGLRDRETGPSLWRHNLTYRFGGADFNLESQSDSAKKFKLTTDCEGFQFKRIRGRPWKIIRPVQTHLFLSEAKSSYQNTGFLNEFELEYEKLMDSIYYLGPLREHPRREYHWARSSPDSVGQRGESTVEAILAATAQGQKRNLAPRKRKKTFQEMIAYWLKELGLIHEFRLEEIGQGMNLYRAMVKTSSSSVPTALTDVGFGVSQVLPALVSLYYVPEGSTVLMEQPEIHLHPSVQSGLADVMIKVAATRNVQIIVESHSEHLMRRLQRRVAEGNAELSSEDVKMYFVSASNGVAQADDLILNKWGEIENWPQHFFGDEMGEVAAIAKATLRRKLDRPE